MANFSTTKASNIIADLMHMCCTLTELNDKEKPYFEVLQFFMSRRYEPHSLTSTPSLKEISVETGLSNAEIKIQLDILYNEIITTGWKRQLFKISASFFIFRIFSYEKEMIFPVQDLKYVPKIGEEVIIPYFTSHLFVSEFIVKKISTHFEDDRHYVHIEVIPKDRKKGIMDDPQNAQIEVARDRRRQEIIEEQNS